MWTPRWYWHFLWTRSVHDNVVWLYPQCDKTVRLGLMSFLPGNENIVSLNFSCCAIVIAGSWELKKHPTWRLSKQATTTSSLNRKKTWWRERTVWSPTPNHSSNLRIPFQTRCWKPQYGRPVKVNKLFHFLRDMFEKSSDHESFTS